MKKIIAIMLMLAMLMSGCGKADTAEPTDATTESTAGTGGITEATEPREATEPTTETAEPTSEATEPTIEESTEPVTDPEPDPYADIKYYPFPLLDMTVAEIEAAYGELEYMYYMYGGTPVYKVSALGYELEFIDVDSLGIEVFDPLPKDAKPVRLRVCLDHTIYPGISVGMGPEDIPDDLDWEDHGLYNLGEGLALYCALLRMDGYAMDVMFTIPDHILEEYPPIYGFTDEQLRALKPWADEFIYNLYDTEICGIDIYKYS